MIWDSTRGPVFLQFVRFMTNAARETLGPGSPMVILLDQSSTMWGLDAQVMI